VAYQELSGQGEPGNPPRHLRTGPLPLPRLRPAGRHRRAADCSQHQN